MTFPAGGHITEPLEAGDAGFNALGPKVKDLASFTLWFISRKDSSYDENIGNDQ